MNKYNESIYFPESSDSFHSLSEKFCEDVLLLDFNVSFF